MKPNEEFYKKSFSKTAKNKKNGMLKNVTPETYGVKEMPKKYYPTFTLKIDDIPEAKKWEVGKTYKIQLEVKQHSMQMDEHEGRVTFEVHKVKVIA